MVIFTKKFGTLDPHLPIVWDKVPKKKVFFTPSLIYRRGMTSPVAGRVDWKFHPSCPSALALALWCWWTNSQKEQSGSWAGWALHTTCRPTFIVTKYCIGGRVLRGILPVFVFHLTNFFYYRYVCYCEEKKLESLNRRREVRGCVVGSICCNCKRFHRQDCKLNRCTL